MATMHHPTQCTCRVSSNPTSGQTDTYFAPQCRDYNKGFQEGEARATRAIVRHLQETANECIKDGDFEASECFANAASWYRAGHHLAAKAEGESK